MRFRFVHFLSLLSSPFYLSRLWIAFKRFPVLRKIRKVSEKLEENFTENFIEFRRERACLSELGSSNLLSFHTHTSLFAELFKPTEFYSINYFLLRQTRGFSKSRKLARPGRSSRANQLLITLIITLCCCHRESPGLFCSARARLDLTARRTPDRRARRLRRSVVYRRTGSSRSAAPTAGSRARVAQ